VEAAVTPQIVDEWFAANAAKTLFTLKSNRYTVGEFYREYQELPPTVQAQYSGAEGMKALAERLIERLLLALDANEQLLDVENQPLIDEARLQVLRQMMDQEEVDDKIEIGDEEVQRFYDENQELLALPPQARIRYIRIGLGNSPEEADAARQRADEAYRKLVPGLFQEGEPFAEVAQEYSEDPETAANGGEMPGWVGGNGGDLFTQLEQHAFNDVVLVLNIGEISRPFEYGGSLYIVQVIERTEPEQMSLEEVRPTIEEILRQQKHEELLVEFQQQLLEQANVEIYQDVLTSYLQQYPTPEPFFPVFEPTPAS
jgi:parvulin-like peptidyl-prolyl isomerase